MCLTEVVIYQNTLALHIIYLNVFLKGFFVNKEHICLDLNVTEGFEATEL